MASFVPVKYNLPIRIAKDITLTFTDAGHILGAAAINLQLRDTNKTHRLTFTGDIGRYSNKILRAPQPFPQADSIICESTYGDKLHQDEKRAQEELLTAVRETCVMKKGKLIIPAFSVGKTQEIIYALNKLEFNGKLPKIKVFVDSPLAINATGIIKKHQECFGESILEFIKKIQIRLDSTNCFTSKMLKNLKPSMN